MFFKRRTAQSHARPGCCANLVLRRDSMEQAPRAYRYVPCDVGMFFHPCRAMSTVLLVDDDFGNRWALRVALESRGHHVVLAENALDALRKADAHFPELIVTDLQMPEMDGRELCWRLKRVSLFADIPVVLLSAMPEPADEIRCWTAFLRKPASTEALLDTVDRLIAARLTYAGARRAAEHPTAARWQAIDSRCWP